MRKFLFLLLAMLATQSFARTIPSGTLRGEVRSVSAGEVRIDKKIFRPAASLRVYDQKNMLVFLRQLPEKSQIAYQVDARNELVQIWMLTPDEAAQK